MEKRATILDIAKQARVSTATVSRVMNNVDYPVKEELRLRVLRVAKELDYRPNIFSQMLKGGESKEIGIIVPSIANPFYAQLVSDVERHCIAAGYAPIICSSYNSPQLEQSHLDMLLRQQVAGVILSTMSTSAGFVQKLNSLPVACVLFDQACEKFRGSTVTFDFRRGGYLATRYLIGSGHTKIAFASPPIDRSSRRLIYDGYKQALRESGIRLHMKRVFIVSEEESEGVGRQGYQSGRLLAEMLMEAQYLPEAVLAINDIIAIGMINALTERRIQVPYDISVLGFDDISFSSMVNPALTTVRQSTAKTAELATSSLLEQIENPAREALQIVIEPEIVERTSVRRIHHKVRN